VNWAILLIAALTTFTLGAREVPHFTLLLGLALREAPVVVGCGEVRIQPNGFGEVDEATCARTHHAVAKWTSES